jgi:hypothetical protein
MCGPAHSSGLSFCRQLVTNTRLTGLDIVILHDRMNRAALIDQIQEARETLERLLSLLQRQKGFRIQGKYIEAGGIHAILGEMGR